MERMNITFCGKIKTFKAYNLVNRYLQRTFDETSWSTVDSRNLSRGYSTVWFFIIRRTD